MAVFDDAFRTNRRSAAAPPLSLLYAAVSALVLCLCGAVLWRLGVRTGGDTGRYVEAATQLLSGQWPTVEKSTNYLGFVAVVAAVKALTGSTSPIVIVNAGALALAGCAVVSLADRLFNRTAAVAAVILFAVNVELAFWSAYVLTDALYASLVVVSTLAMLAAAESSSTRGYGAAIVLIVATASVRPNGWLLVPIALVFWIGAGSRTRLALVTAGVVVVTLAAATLIPALTQGVASESPQQSLVNGTVLWRSPIWKRTMPAAAPMPQSWIEGGTYVLQHPVPSVLLAVTRVGVEVAHVRPYYSLAHNALVCATYLPLYALAVAGAWFAWSAVQTRLVVSIIGAHLALVGLTFADYDGRFILYVVPLLTLLAAGGLGRLIDDWSWRRIRTADNVKVGV